MSSDIREDGALVDVERSPFTQEEADILDSLVAGRGVLMNANVGFGVKISGTHDGRVSIDVDPAPIFEKHDGPAVREFMEKVAVMWLEVVAPERLAK